MADVALTQGRVAIIDDESLDDIRGYVWRVMRSSNTRFYAITTVRIDGKKTTLLMHRVILRLRSIDLDVDHVNGNGLDNRRVNLRLATQSQNSANSPGCPVQRKSKYKGVHWHRDSKMKAGGLWVAQIKVHGTGMCCYAATEVEAAVEYNELALKHFGEFARLNDVPCSWPEHV